MFWQEDDNDESVFVVPDDVVDLAFNITCRTLPVDHAWALSEAVIAVLPWLAEDPRAGLHLIHTADSGNGWERPEGEGDLLYPSRRTKLMLRVPKERVEDAQALVGATLDVDGHLMQVGEAKIRLLSVATSLYARYMALSEGQDENEFLAEAVKTLRERRLQFKKVLCGKVHELKTPDGPLRTVSLMVSDLPLTDSVRLQEEGLGALQHRGCGLFIAHKSV